jgi:hypothetical protein
MVLQGHGAESLAHSGASHCGGAAAGNRRRSAAGDRAPLHGHQSAGSYRPALQATLDIVDEVAAVGKGEVMRAAEIVQNPAEVLPTAVR